MGRALGAVVVFVSAALIGLVLVLATAPAELPAPTSTPSVTRGR